MSEENKNNNDDVQNSVNTEIKDTSLQTEIADENEGLTHDEIEKKLEQAQTPAVDYAQRQATKPTGLEAISSEELALVDDDVTDTEDTDCLNCSAPLKGPYCHNCGQPDRHFIRFFPKVLIDLFNEAFDFDSRVFRTLVPLLLFPGRLSMEYIAGRRARYVNPLRLYVFLSVIFFISISLFTDTNDTITINGTDGKESISIGSKDNNAESEKIITDTANLLREQQKEGIPIDDDIIDDLETTLDGLEDDFDNQDSDNSGIMKKDGTMNIEFNDKPWDLKTNPILFNGIFNEETTQELNLFLWDMAKKLHKTINEDSSSLVDEFFNVIPQMMFILLPLFALILKFAYIFKKRFYMEHLIVALHGHCFIFFTLFLIIILNAINDSLVTTEWIKETIDTIALLLVVWIPINIYIMQKRVYAQGYIMTTLKFIFVGVSYWALLMLTGATAFVVGLVSL